MPLNIKKPSNATAAVVITASLLAAAAGAAGTYYAVKDDIVKDVPTTNDPIPQGISSPPNLEESIPAGTVSPTTIFAKPDDYVGKETKVRGRIIETAPNKYIVVGQETKSPGAILLAFEGTTLDPKAFIGGYTDESKSTENNEYIGAVTVSGKITRDDAIGLILTAKTIEK